MGVHEGKQEESVKERRRKQQESAIDTERSKVGYPTFDRHEVHSVHGLWKAKEEREVQGGRKFLVNF